MIGEQETWFSSYYFYFKGLNLADVILRHLLSHRVSENCHMVKMKPN
jgi:hypothetical protein